jgi:hypothetical protein
VVFVGYFFQHFSTTHLAEHPFFEELKTVSNVNNQQRLSTQRQTRWNQSNPLDRHQ